MNLLEQLRAVTGQSDLEVLYESQLLEIGLEAGLRSTDTRRKLDQASDVVRFRDVLEGREPGGRLFIVVSDHRGGLLVQARRWRCVNHVM